MFNSQKDVSNANYKLRPKHIPNNYDIPKMDLPTEMECQELIEVPSLLQEELALQYGPFVPTTSSAVHTAPTFFPEERQKINMYVPTSGRINYVSFITVYND